MSERSTSTLLCSSNSRYAGSAAAASPRASVVSYSSAGVATSPYPRASNTARIRSVIARSSRISSGRTSRVPEGIGSIIALPWLGLDALDARAEVAQALVDPLVPAVDLPHVVDLALALGTQGGDQDRHAGADVGRGQARPAQPPRPDHDRPVRVADRDLGAHRDQFVDEEQPVLEHLLEDQDRALGLRGEGDRDRREVRREGRPRAVLDLGLVVARVARDDELLAARDDDVAALPARMQPEALEHEADHPHVLGHALADAKLPAGHPGQRHERGDLDVVGRDGVLAAPELAHAVDVQ